MSAQVAWSCVGCGVRLETEPVASIPACPRCGATNPWAPSGEVLAGKGPDRCAVCGRNELYREKVVNRAVGLGIVILAVVLAPFTYYISLAVAALLDALLYRILHERGVCYLCRAEYRDFPGIPSLEKFDLHVAQVMTRYKWPPQEAEKHA